MAKKAVAKKPAKSKAKPSARKSAHKHLLLAPAEVIQLHSIGGNQPFNGVLASRPFTVVGFVKPPGSTVEVRLYSRTGTIGPHTATVTQYRWEAAFTPTDIPIPDDYLLEACISGSSANCYVSMRVV